MVKIAQKEEGMGMGRGSIIWGCLGLLIIGANTASAMCIENRSERNIAIVRGKPFGEMPTFYQAIIGPQGYQCVPMPLDAEGNTPVSVYVIDDRGRCQVATGCYYENADDENVFVGAGTNGCVTSFKASDCASAKR